MGTSFRDRPQLHELVEGDDLGLDEAPLEVGVDDTSRLRSRPPLVDRPGPRLLLAGGQVGLQPQRVEADARQLVQTGLLLAVVVQHLRGLVGLKLHEFGLKLGVKEDGLGRSHQLAQLGLLGLVVHALVIHVEHVDEGLGGHELEGAQRLGVQPRLLSRGGQQRALLQDLQRRLGGVQHGSIGLLPAHFLLQARDRLLQGLDVGQ